MSVTPTGLDLSLCANCQHDKHIGMTCMVLGCGCDDVQARKNSKGKIGCFYLLPWEAIMELAAVYEYGAKKYAANSWREVPKDPVTGAEPHERYFDAMMRHIVAIQRGEEFDPESGLRHIAHVMWGACALAELTRKK
jgi:hypothetical protein